MNPTMTNAARQHLRITNVTMKDDPIRLCYALATTIDLPNSASREIVVVSRVEETIDGGSRGNMAFDLLVARLRTFIGAGLTRDEVDDLVREIHARCAYRFLCQECGSDRVETAPMVWIDPNESAKTGHVILSRRADARRIENALLEGELYIDDWSENGRAWCEQCQEHKPLVATPYLATECRQEDV